MNWYKKAQGKFDVSEMEKYDNPIEQHLAMIKTVRGKGIEGFHYGGPEDFILQHGKHYQSNPMTKEEIAFMEEVAWKTCGYKMKQCFYNAQSLAMTSPKIKYVEGYLYSGIIPVEHAWNTLNNKVIDFTMSHANNDKPILGDIPEGWDYFGVQLSSGPIAEYWSKYKMSEPFITNWREEYPLLRKPFKPEEPEESEDELV